MKPEIEQITEKPKIPMGDGKVIYIAGKYHAETDYGITENIWHACRVAVRLWELGWVCLCPHMNTAHFDIYSSLPRQVYLEGDLKLLARCEAIFMLKGWESSLGAKRELEVAVERKMAIFYE